MSLGQELNIMSKIRRIQFSEGPGVGKSSVAPWVFSKLKELGINAEFVQEYVKNWSYQNREISKYDQVYLFGKQQNREYNLLSKGVDFIVTDSPVFLCGVYTGVYFGTELADSLFTISDLYDEDYPCLTIIIERPDNQEYKEDGRYQTSSEAEELHNFIKEKTFALYPDTKIFYNNQREEILEYVLSQIKI